MNTKLISLLSALLLATVLSACSSNADNVVNEQDPSQADEKSDSSSTWEETYVNDVYPDISQQYSCSAACDTLPPRWCYSACLWADSCSLDAAAARVCGLIAAAQMVLQLLWMAVFELEVEVLENAYLQAVTQCS